MTTFFSQTQAHPLWNEKLKGIIALNPSKFITSNVPGQMLNTSLYRGSMAAFLFAWLYVWKNSWAQEDPTKEEKQNILIESPHLCNISACSRVERTWKSKKSNSWKNLKRRNPLELTRFSEMKKGKIFKCKKR